MTACSKGAKAKRVDSAALNKKDAKDVERWDKTKCRKKLATLVCKLASYARYSGDAKGKIDQHFSSAEQRAVLSLLRLLSDGSNIGRGLGRCLAAWASDAKPFSLAGGGVLGPPGVPVVGKRASVSAPSRLP